MSNKPEIPSEKVISEQNTDAKKQATKIARRAPKTLVTDHASREKAATFLSELKGVHKDLSEKRLTITRPMDQAKAAVMALFKPHLTQIEEAETFVKQQIATFDKEERARVEKAQREAEEEARKKQAEIDRKAAARAAKIEKDAAEKAAKLLAEGKEEEAEVIIESAAEKADAVVENRKFAETKSVATVNTSSSGASTRTIHKGEGVDLMKTIQAIAAGNAPITLVKFDDVVIGQMARSLRGAMQYDGIRFYEQLSVSARSK